MPEPMVDADWLRAHIDDPLVRVVEVQFEEDEFPYGDGHLPGALNWYWKDAFWHPTEREFATPEQMARWIGAAGATAEHTLVLYSDRTQYAMYGSWAFGTMAGHPDIRVLSGGRRAWVAAGGELTTDVPEYAAADYGLVARATRDDGSRIRRDELLERLGAPGVVILDARYEEEYRGDRVKPGTGVDHGAERHGRIPGAVSLPFHTLRDERFRVRPVAELEAAFRAVGAAPDQADEVIVYCRLGHRASMLWFTATELLGWDHVRVYDGSWTEWGSVVGVPIER